MYMNSYVGDMVYMGPCKKMSYMEGPCVIKAGILPLIGAAAEREVIHRGWSAV